jgi:hypothetical protein
MPTGVHDGASAVNATVSNISAWVWLGVLRERIALARPALETIALSVSRSERHLA